MTFFPQKKKTQKRKKKPKEKKPIAIKGSMNYHSENVWVNFYREQNESCVMNCTPCFTKFLSKPSQELHVRFVAIPPGPVFECRWRAPNQSIKKN